MMQLKVALAQWDVQWGDVAANVARVRVFAEQARDNGARWLILPEMWATDFDWKNGENYGTVTAEGVFAQVAEIGREFGLHIIGSSFSAMGDGKLGNTQTWHDAEGVLLGSYSKMHLFGLMNEDRYLQGGDRPMLVSTRWGSFGMAICYDLRFPELFRLYALQGATGVVISSAWPHPRLNHWRTLLRARAIENQMFIFACNRTGARKGVAFFGYSVVIDPWGDVVVEGGEEEGVLYGEVELSLTAEVRQRIPVFADRRPEVYGREVG